MENSKTFREERQNLEQNIPGLWENYKRYDKCIMGISEGKERKKNKRNI